ncbi:MAG TPA: CBS domain-containing protein [Steroidobacteraceae bacterium]|nr:CBS domain-containing protein [Steroidobacteraceae bacterium]
MHISQILRNKRPDIIRISPDATVRAAVALMTREQVGALAVVDSEEELLGVISERDVIHSLDSRGERLMTELVRNVMRSDGPIASVDDSVRSVMEVMTASRARHVPVVRFGRLIGIVSIGDVVKSRLDETTQENSILQDIARSHWLTG